MARIPDEKNTDDGRVCEHSVELDTITQLQTWCCELLGTDVVEADETFLELGGESMQIALLLAKIQSRYGVEISFSEFFMIGTVGDLAIFVERQVGGGDGNDVIVI